MPLKKIIYIYLFCSFIIPIGVLVSQVTESSKPLSNILIFDNELKKTLLKIENIMVILGKDKIYNFHPGGTDEQKEFFMKGVRKYLNDYKVVFGDSVSASALADYSVNIVNFNPEINYTDVKPNIVLDKKINRKLVLSFKFEFKDKVQNTVSDSGLLKESFDDVISYDDLNQAEVSTYSFSRGQLPKQSLFEKILIPGIAVLASAAAIVLFFIIRSK